MQVKQVGHDYQLMLMILFFLRLGQFMLLPFLAIYLLKHYSASSAMVGLVVGMGPLAYGIAGFVAGVIVDRIGVKPVMIASILTAAVSIYFFFYYDAIAWLFFMNSITGITRSLFDVASKSYAVGDLTIEQRKLCFSLRYIIINSAAAIGPIAGAYFATHNSLFVFKFIGLMYLAVSVLAIRVLKNTNKMDKSVSFHTISETISAIAHDHALQILLLLTFLIWAFFSQIDSTLPQYLYESLSNGVPIYSGLLIINAVGCVSLQMIIARALRNYSDISILYLSMFLFAAGYLLFALALRLPALIVGMSLITLAEILILPLNDILLVKMAPIKLVGTYYGAIATGMLGLGVGPMLGGVIYEYTNAFTLFLLCTLMALSCIFLYKLLFKVMAKQAT